MAEYIVQDKALTSVADAIRDKGNTTEQLSFPDGMVDAIGKIDTRLPEQEKTAAPNTSEVVVTPDDGHTLSKVTVSAMPAGTLKTPTISSSGLITSQVDTSGYLAGGTQKTLQIATSSGGTYMPTTYDRTLVSSGRYTTGSVVMAGDSNLVSSNIRSGVSIFGVTGTMEASNFVYGSSSAYCGGGTSIAFTNMFPANGSYGLVSFTLIRQIRASSAGFTTLFMSPESSDLVMCTYYDGSSEMTLGFSASQCSYAIDSTGMFYVRCDAGYYFASATYYAKVVVVSLG